MGDEAHLDAEHRSRREFEPDPKKTLDLKGPVPRLREIEVATFAKPVDLQRLVADPPTVVANGVLKPRMPDARYKVHMFAHGLKGFVPNRIGAVVPGGLTDFTRALIFFHPLPTKAAGFNEAQYADQTGNWPKVYRYCDQQGSQLAASGRKMVLILPIFPLAATETCGRFPAEWKSLIEDIMVMLRKAHAPGQAGEARPVLKDVITASFSAGVKYMHTFLTRAGDLGGLLREVYDYDGRFSSHADLSEKLRVHGAKVITYDQHPVKLSDVVKEEALGKGIHAPEPRWHDLPGGFTSFLDLPNDTPFVPPIKGSRIVHGAIPRFLMFHSLSESGVGK